jgi:hypothetical protein
MEAVFIISTIIQIILIVCFFILCLDVSKIRKRLTRQYDFESRFNFLISIGEKEKAKEMLLERILTNDIIFDKKMQLTTEARANKAAELYAKELEALGIDISEIIKE